VQRQGARRVISNRGPQRAGLLLLYSCYNILVKDAVLLAGLRYPFSFLLWLFCLRHWKGRARKPPIQWRLSRRRKPWTAPALGGKKGTDSKVSDPLLLFPVCWRWLPPDEKKIKGRARPKVFWPQPRTTFDGPLRCSERKGKGGEGVLPRAKREGAIALEPILFAFTKQHWQK